MPPPEPWCFTLSAAQSAAGVQSAENWFEDAGSGQLRNGSAQIALDPTFAQTVNTAVECHVFLTPNGATVGDSAATHPVRINK
jgi:hypothetical protein